MALRAAISLQFDAAAPGQHITASKSCTHGAVHTAGVALHCESHSKLDLNETPEVFKTLLIHLTVHGQHLIAMLAKNKPVVLPISEIHVLATLRGGEMEQRISKSCFLSGPVTAVHVTNDGSRKNPRLDHRKIG